MKKLRVSSNLLLLLGIFLQFSLGVVSAQSTFPVLQFYGAQITDAVKFNPLLYFSIIDKYLCSGSTAEKTHCSCLPSCAKHSTCCIDYLWTRQNGTTWSGSLDEYVQYFLSQQSRHVACQQIIKAKDVSLGNIQHVTMVTGCPGEENGNEFELVPVFGDDGVVYSNPSVAECQGVQNFRPLSIDVSCNFSMTSESTEYVPESSRDCRYRIPESFSIKTCSPQNSCASAEKTSTEENQRENSALCTRYGGQIMLNEQIYNNIHCAKCANLTEPYRVLVQPSPHVYKINLPMPYSVTISYGKHGQEAIYDNNGNKVRVDYQCRTMEIYDIVRRKCLPFLCSHGYKQEGLQCIKLETVSGGNITDENDDVIAKLTKCILSSPQGANIYLNISNGTLFSYPEAEPISSTNTFKIYRIAVSNDEKELQNITSWLRHQNITAEQTILTVRNQLVETELYGLSLSRAFPAHHICHSPVPVDTGARAISVTPDCSLNISGGITPSGSFLTHLIMAPESRVVNYRLYTCDKFHLNSSCPRFQVPLESSKSYWLYPNGSIFLSAEKIMHSVEEYSPLKRGISICITNYIIDSKTGGEKPPDWLRQTEEAQSYLTLVAGLVSIPCYIFVIVVYLRAKELRTIPGRNIICICIALLLSDIFILSTMAIGEQTTGCRVLASLLHYSLLAAQAWSCIISFEIWLTFRKGTSSRFAKSNKRFVWYCVFGFVLPFTMVAIFSSLDSFQVLNVDYGLQICWINSLLHKIMLYLVPVALISCYNFTTILYILRKIYSQQKQSTALLNKTSDHKEATVLKTALKLFLLLGLVEVIGFIQIPTNQETWKGVLHVLVQFIFVFFRGFRGLFIWILYIYMNERAWTRKKCRESNSYSPRGSQTTLTTVKKYSIGPSKSSYKITQTLDDARL